ncbi:putative oxidoreductase [Caulobacter ginsengisoli]|uniref:Oxidoreductase n=1 Tax=Caulobacter ginsengisoli TaxID=400775 RepID=A0ABU0IT94_9CAUL|nr:DoxX family protein [Caulobacter ginsengisoli]MDQ0465232.1 putative oxidoreductase [Caulobacter ginsengisoli]
MRKAGLAGGPTPETAALLIRVLLGTLFIAHLYWKLAILPGGLEAWWGNLRAAGYPAFVPAYVLSAEVAGAVLLIPGVMPRYVALYAMPMMLGAAQFWLARKGFYFTRAGAELPLVWLALLGVQAVAGDGALAAVRSPDPRRVLAWLGRRGASPGRAA